MSSLGSVEINGKYINLDSLSLEKMKKLFSKINDNEEMLKQEIDTILKRLM